MLRVFREKKLDATSALDLNAYLQVECIVEAARKLQTVGKVEGFDVIISSDGSDLDNIRPVVIDWRKVPLKLFNEKLIFKDDNGAPIETTLFQAVLTPINFPIIHVVPNIVVGKTMNLTEPKMMAETAKAWGENYDNVLVYARSSSEELYNGLTSANAPQYAISSGWVEQAVARGAVKAA